MKYAEIIKGLRAQREAKLAAMTELHTTAATETRTFDEAEGKKFAALEAEVSALDVQIKSTETMERLSAGSTKPVEQPGSGNGSGSALEVPDNSRVVHQPRKLAKGTAFTRYAMALAASKGNLIQAAETAKQWRETTPEVERVLKAAVSAGTTSDAAWASPIVDHRLMAEEFIELLYPQTIQGKMAGFRRVPFNVRIPRATGGVAVGWVGEGNPKPVSKQAFDTVTMPESKIAGIVVLTMELARFSTPSAEQLVRDDMIAAIATYSDAQFINPAVTGNSGVNPASITNGAASKASAGATLANIESDLLAARMNMVNANIPLQGCYWIMSPSTKIHLAELRTAMDVLAFPTIDANGTLKGIPVIDSVAVGQFDSDGAGANVAANYIALISAPQVLIADDGQVLLDASSEASIAMTDDGSGTTLTSLWQRNMIGVRAERLVHWLRRRTQAAFVITDVAY